MRNKESYFLNTEVANKIDRGYKLIIDNKPSDIDDDFMYMVLSAMEEIEYKNIYVVGCGLGDILINLKRLKPKAIVSGCEVDDTFRSFGNNHFKIDNEEVVFEIKEPPYYKVPYADVMVSLNYLSASHEGVETFKDMLFKADKIIVFDPREVRDYLETQVEGLIFEDFDMYTIYDGIQPELPPEPSSRHEFLNSPFLASGIYHRTPVSG